MKSKWMLFFLGAMALMAASPMALAAGGSVFSVYPQYTSGQLDPDAGYFFILAEPGEAQTLTVTAVNDSDSDILLYAESANAYTSPTGELVYVGQDTDNYGYADTGYIMAQNIEVSAEPFTLRSGESSPVSLSVTVPDIPDSEFIGAVCFYTLSVGETEDGGNAAADESVNIKNAQAIPVRIVTGQLAAAPNAPLTISDVAFDGAQNQPFFTVENKLATMVVLKRLTYEVSDGLGNTTAPQELSPVKLAPRAWFRIYLDETDDPPIPGDYSLLVGYQYHDSETRENRTFTVNEAQPGAPPTPAQSAAAPSPTPAPAPSASFISTGAVIAVLIAVALIVLLIILRYRRRKKQQQGEKTDL